MVRQNLGYKLAALIASVALWFYVTGEQVSPSGASITVPLQARNVPHGLQVIDAPKDVTVTLPRGFSGDIKQGVHAFMNLASCKPGTNLQVQVKAEPAGAVVTPDRVQVVLGTVHSEARKVMVISARIDGKPAPGYEISDIVIEPTEITISGPVSLLDRMNVIRTEPVNISGVSGNITQEVGLEIPPGAEVQGADHIKVIVRIQPQ